MIIEEGITRIGYRAFQGCEGLTSITIPDSVTSIGVGAFFPCIGLTDVYYQGDLSGWLGIVFGDHDSNPMYYADNLYINGELLQGDVVIPEGTEKIGNYAFSDCTGLTSITIPDSVTSIGDRAFSDCTALTSITIPDSVTSIGDRAFSGCTGLTDVYYQGDLSGWLGIQFGDIWFGGYASNPMYHADNLYINGELLQGELVIPEGTETIGDYVFYNCSGLTSITIPDSVTSIGEEAFMGCSSLKSIEVEKGNSRYHSKGNCLIETASKTLIAGCKTSIIPTDGSVTFIGDCAFSYCTGLTSITIPDSVTSIGDDAFDGCSGLTDVYYQGDLSGWLGIQFDSSDSNPMYYADNLYINGEMLQLQGEFVIPEGTEKIGAYAFRGCNGLTSITIPDSVTSIGRSAFSGCSGLTSITIPDSVTSIGDRAFYGCTGLTRITIPDSVTSIGTLAFNGCSGLTSITIPNSVTSIGDHAFYGCTGLTSITIPDSVTSIGDWAFDDCRDLTDITFQGTMQQWTEMSKSSWWSFITPDYTVTCTDGVLDKDGQQIG